MNKQQTIKSCILILQSFQSQLPYPSAFLDFNSAPALEFTLTWLIVNRIKQCFIMYSKSKAQVEKYFQNSHTKQIKINLIYVKDTQSKSLGDFLREANFRQLVSDDFLLIHGDVITNLSLKQLVDQHLRRKQLSKINILTVALTYVSTSSNIFLIHDNSKQILQMQDKNKNFELNNQRCKIKYLNQYSVRGDLGLTNVYICSNQVLKSFKETFQFQTMNDFINGMLTSQIYQQKIYAYLLKNNQFSSKIGNPIEYYQAYFNLISRYLYPYTVTTGNKFTKSTQHKYLTKYIDYNKYIKTDCDLSQVKLSHGIYIGQGTVIKQNSNLFKTIINKNCIIGVNCTLKYCIVLQGTVIPDYSQFNFSLIYSKDNKIQVLSYQNFIQDQAEALYTQNLFPQTPEQVQNFNQELQILLSQNPTPQTYQQLSSLRKMFNKQTKELVSQSISILNPTNIKQIQKCVQNWGSLLKKICLDQANQFIQALLYCGQKKPTVKSAFHIYLQYSYKYDHLSDDQIIDWYENNKFVAQKKIYIDLIKAFVQRLIQEKQEQSSEENSNDEDDENE